MAKHCDVCNQDYADDLPLCPHCASAKKTHLAGRAEDRTTQLAGPAEDRTTQLADLHPEEPTAAPAPSDSALDLGQSPAAEPTGEPMSGASSIAWSSLAESPHGEEVKIDSPSDTDLLGHGAEQTAEEPAGALPADADADIFDLEEEEAGEAVVPVSDSTVDLGASPVVELVEDEPSVPRSGSDVFVAELASDASHVDLVDEPDVDLGGSPPVTGEAPSDSASTAEVVEAGIDPTSPEAELTEEAALDALVADEHSSAVDLGATVAPSDPTVPAEEADEVVEVVSDSAIDLSGLPVPSASGSDPRSPSDSAVDLGSHAEIEAPRSPSAEEGESAFLGESEFDLGGVAPSAAPEADNLALESLLAEESGMEPPLEEAPAVAEEEAVVADDDGGLVAADEPVVSEAEVDDLLAGLDEPSPPPDELAALTEEAEVNEAIGEAAAEEETAKDDEGAPEPEETKPVKPVKPRSRFPALVGGAFLGLLVGAGALIGARVGGFDVPAMIGLTSEDKKAASKSATPPPLTFADKSKMVKNGDFDEAAKAGIEQIQETNPEELAVRGDNRLNAYLQKSGGKVNPQDPPLQQAIADLQKAAEAKNPDAIFNLGYINELANNFPKAREEYTKGATLFQADPIQKRRFQAALDRVEWKAAGKAGGAAFAPLPERLEDRVALLALLVIGFQPPPQGAPPAPPAPPGAPPQAGGEEAGFDFWQAARLARDGKYVEAAQAIDKAREVHDQRRFSRLRKAQNPLSDPTEDIFLRCCDELKQYWLLQDPLRKGGYLTDKNTPPQAVDDLLKKTQASAELVKAVTDKLIAEKLMAEGDDLSKTVDKLLADKKDADTMVADLTKKLKTATDEASTLAGKLKTAEQGIKDRDAKLTTAAEEEKKLKAANDDLKATFTKISEALKTAKFLEPEDKPDLADSVRKALEIATMKDPEGEIRKQRGDIARLTAALKETRSPEQMMPLWLLLLDQNRTRLELADQATLDVNRVKANPAANAAQQGQAQLVLGLALRNTDRFDEAKPVLEAARAAVDKSDWLILADLALKDVLDPAAYYLGKAEKLYDSRAAAAVLEHALKVLKPAQRPRVLARRSSMELDAALAQAKGKLSARDPIVAAARRDAEAAANANVAEGHYVVGRIAEELGQLNAAIQSYRKALAAHRALDAEGGRYRAALARVLSQPREGQPGGPGPGVGWVDPARHVADAKRFLVMVTTGLQPPDVPDDQPGLGEAEKLADEILNAPPGTMPFDVRAQALAVKGRWTLALQTYAEGVLPLLPPEYRNGLRYLVLNHPRLKRPDSLRTPNPAEAARLFASGMNFYFARDYANAEKAFLLTVENDSQDARYFYFLGLSRLAQNRRRDALDDFDQGAMLERLDRPSAAAVSEALERIQGRTRRIVNEVRNRPER